MTALVDELAYVVLDTVDLEAWRRFATNLLGFEAVEVGTTLRLRMDDRAYRYLLRRGPAESGPILGWQVADGAAIDVLSKRLDGLGVRVAPLADDELAEREAQGGAAFTCHNGIRQELVWGLPASGAFAPSGDVSGFVTASGGLGHVVWTVPDLPHLDDIILKAFGMALREDIPTPAGRGHFYGCNPRHHSLAGFAGPALRIEHIMVEMKELDDVGRAMDRSADLGYALVQPLGRHRTDHMVSFYVQTPSGFGMEIGCHGVLCGDDWATVRDSKRCRPWGHGAGMRNHHKKSAAPVTPADVAG
ncbi:MAG: VOC family protein [Devosia sp.]|jgi:2,3-dihydroxybiphenyl 1,2-dioxygenase|nr:VOC family protein [Devosia sp.]